MLLPSFYLEHAAALHLTGICCFLPPNWNMLRPSTLLEYGALPFNKLEYSASLHLTGIGCSPPPICNKLLPSTYVTYLIHVVSSNYLLLPSNLLELIFPPQPRICRFLPLTELPPQLLSVSTGATPLSVSTGASPPPSLRVLVLPLPLLCKYWCCYLTNCW